MGSPGPTLSVTYDQQPETTRTVLRPDVLPLMNLTGGSASGPSISFSPSFRVWKKRTGTMQLIAARRRCRDGSSSCWPPLMQTGRVLWPRATSGDCCRRLEDAGWLRTLRAPNLQLAVELTDAGRGQAAPWLQAEVDAQERKRRESTACMLTSLPGSAADVPANVRLNGQDFLVRSAAYVVRLDGTTCLQLELPGGALRWLPADALQVAEWYQACVRAGLPSRVQVNADAPAAGAGENAQ